jgi:peptide deformylase
MSDELLVIDTSKAVTQNEIVEPLPLYGEGFEMLYKSIPEYTDILPNPLMNKLVQRLKLTMKLYAGIGLSANQCGVYQRVFVIGHEDYQLVCINPKVTHVSEQIEKSNEGCLSYPGLFVKIERPLAINVEFTTETGENKQMKLEGLTARCFMHELEHMNGQSFIQHVKPVALSIAKEKQKKRIKKVTRAQKNGIRI